MGSTYLTGKMTAVTALLTLMALMNGVQMEDPLVVDSSGDGESADTMSPVSLIDDNGDIHTEFPTTVDPSTNVSVKSEMDLAEVSSPKASNESASTTMLVNIVETSSEYFPVTSTAAPAEATATTTTQSTQTNPPTTQSTKPDTTTAVPESTTVTTTTSTMMPPTVADEVTTEAEMETSTLSSEATVPEKMDKSTESTPKRSTTESVALTPASDRSVCTFYVDEDFSCTEDVICYGDGEIDCTDYDDEDAVAEADVANQMSTYSKKITVMGKIDERPLADTAMSTDGGNTKSSAKPGDYAEYDAEESDVIETFPPSLIGVASRKRIPFILRTLAPTEGSPTVADEVPTTSTTRIEEAERVSTTVTVQPENKDLMENPMTTVSFSTTENMEGSDISRELVSQAATAVESTSTTYELSENRTNLTSAETSTVDEDSASNKTSTGSVDEENVEVTTESDKTLAMPSTTPFKELLTQVRRRSIRKKREETVLESNSTSSSQSPTFHAASLESSQRKLRVKACRLSGSLVCTPTATVTMCKGKAQCRATGSPADTTESATLRGVETWAIIVIVVCALSGFLTICLLIYLVVTSCKKLKVQPSIEVTTLNYINRGATNEEA